MEFQHFTVKVFMESPLGEVNLETYIQIFHRWIQDSLLDEILIDVADYRHLTEGPGVVLVAHEADYSMDGNGGRLGLLYRCKVGQQGSNQDRLKKATVSALAACDLLEKESSFAGELKFNRRELEISVNDRALAPNTEKTFSVLKPELEEFLGKLCGEGQFSVSYQQGDPRGLFRVRVDSKKNFLAESV
ncbi:MAG: hypothetical protein DF168_00483 [Candidatus Moanabacter tarae]|uniref:Uncharacterized protein n=1 Tax=Candidatus Moanibacter tarae TaxID=2200854 RepID=A0A2Z4ABF6_9BACT|nr:MAG: hypothetical protein DF168_00483 [Candidatus Moanabacter tarae]|tara:strand:+ start:10752 stop:11318 length:567 start_codon:yes stop_codon:yes gene_type:complete